MPHYIQQCILWIVFCDVSNGAAVCFSLTNDDHLLHTFLSGVFFESYSAMQETTWKPWYPGNTLAMFQVIHLFWTPSVLSFACEWCLLVRVILTKLNVRLACRCSRRHQPPACCREHCGSRRGKISWWLQCAISWCLYPSHKYFSTYYQLLF